MELDALLKMMDEMIIRSDVRLTLKMPEGTQDCILKDNIGFGPVGQFFVLMKGMQAAFNEFNDMIDGQKMEECVDAILGLLKQAIMEDCNGHKDDQ